MQNYLLLCCNESRIFFSGGYGICICRNYFDDGHPLIKPRHGRVTRQILHEQVLCGRVARWVDPNNPMLLEAILLKCSSEGSNAFLYTKDAGHKAA